ncbi:MAG: hypothetical protein AAF662_11450 [Pseudomonadota bacterium]
MEFDVDAALLGLATGLITALLARGIIPAFMAYRDRRREIRTFQTYLLVQATDSLSHFGREFGTQSAAAHDLPEGSRDTDWFRYLHDNDLGLPEFFIGVAESLVKTRQNIRYTPGLAYVTSSDTVLEPDSTLWKLSDDDTRAASKYFTTEKHLQQGVDDLYVEWFFALSVSEEFADRDRWCRAVEDWLHDLAEHYRAAKVLQQQMIRAN